MLLCRQAGASAVNLAAEADKSGKKRKPDKEMARAVCGFPRRRLALGVGGQGGALVFLRRHRNGQLSWVGMFIDGALNGPYTEWDNAGRRLRNGPRIGVPSKLPTQTPTVRSRV